MSPILHYNPSNALQRNKVFPVSLVLPPSATAASFSDQLLLQFDDVRDAGKAYDIAIDNIKSADVYFLDPKAAARYAGETDVSTYNDISSYNDEVIITLVCKEDPPFANYNELVHFIVSSISRCFSKPKAFACLAPHGLEFRVEFFKKTTAISAVACGAIDYDVSLPLLFETLTYQCRLTASSSALPLLVMWMTFVLVLILP